MGCHVSEKQTHQTKNFLNDCNGVYHASIPRKLRSAMKKRSRESILLDSEKVNHKINGIESPKKDSVKKSKKQGIISPNWSPRGGGVSGPITKDEEEVAETLYAMAGMFPSNHNSRELDGKSLQENSSVLQDLKDNANVAAIEASATGQGASPCPESLPGEASKITSLNETIGQGQPERATLSHSSTPTINLQTMPGMVKHENCNKVVALHDAELCLAMGLNVTRQSRISQSERKLDIELEAARDVDSKQKQHLIKEQIENEGLALWPGSSSVSSAGKAYQQSLATKAPDWLEAAICASKQDLMETSTCSSSGKISEVVIHKRTWKRCAAHVHISHMIRSLDVPKKGTIKESELYECHEMRAHEGQQECGVLLEIHSLNRMRNGVTSTTVRNPCESKNGILQQQCHYGNISQAAPSPTPGVYGPQKQSFNFLSLSAGNYGLKVDNNYNKTGSTLEQLYKMQVPYFQSLAQQHGVMPIPTPRSHYASTLYLDQLSVVGPQLRLQQPHYYGSPLCGTQYSSTVSNKQEHQNFWGLQVQQAAQGQGRSLLNCNIMRTQDPNWQNGRHDSSASQEIFGSNITSLSRQQQLLIPPVQDKWARSSSPFYM